MATNFNTNPFGIYAHPFSGSIETGSTVDVINFVNSSPFFTSSKQADAGSIGINYTQIGMSGSNAGAAADIVFKVSGKEAANKDAAEVFRISATGSNNTPRVGIGMGKGDTVDAPLHVKGDTVIEGGRILFTRSNESDIEITKDDFENLIQGTAVADTAKNSARGGLTRTFAANALVNLADSTTLVKANETGKLELKANNLTLVEVDATDASAPVVNIGDKPAGKVLMTGSLDVTGSNVTFDVEDLLTLLGNFGQTGSFAVSGSSDFTGDVNMDGNVTVTDLLSVVAGFNSTGSAELSGSLTITGSTAIKGNTTTEKLILSSGGQSTDTAIHVNGDPDTGIYFPALNNISLQAGGGTVEVNLNTDNVQLRGDVLAYNKFTVSGSLNASGSVTMKDLSAGGTGTYFEHSGLTSGATVKVQVGDVDNLGNETKLIVDDGNETVTISGSLDITGNQVDFTNLPTSDPGVAGRLYQTASAAMGMTAGKQVVLISA